MSDYKEILSIIFSLLTCLIMILAIVLFPSIKIKSISLDTYWIIVIIGMMIVVGCSGVELKYLGKKLIEDTEINPLKILALFISLSILSVYLDEIGFFQYLATIIQKKAKSSQKKLFISLYGMISILTIFASNDVIILAFTPFICYLSKHAGISPMPYLVSEFVTANSWSMTLLIGNPTNIFLGASYDVDFIDYLKIMIVPTIASGIASFIILFLIFRNELSKPISSKEIEEHDIKDKPLLVEGLVHLIICVILLAIGSYINLEMWIVSLVCVGSLIIFILITSAIEKRKPIELGETLKRAPWELIPFVLGMYIIICVIHKLGVTEHIGNFLGDKLCIIKYGILTVVSCNFINNIPMSFLFSAIMEDLKDLPLKEAIYSTVVASNIGAFFTPIGSLAGIMFTSILNKFEIKFGFIQFLKMGFFVALPSIIVCLVILYLMLLAFN